MAVDGLRPRRRPRMVFSGFTNAEVEKMEKLLKDAKRPLNKEFYQKVSRSFSSSAARAGKPIVRWTEVQSWFEKRLQDFPGKVPSSSDTSKDDSLLPDTSTSNEAKGNSQMNKDPKAGERTLDISKMAFEARSSKDGAWYDVDRFLSHRTLASGEPEVRVRYDGFGPEEDEWINVKNAVRRRSVPVEHSECHKVTVGDLVCCFQETKDRANHYDAHVIQIQRKMHDVRGCRCLFFVRYDHDKTEERVHLRQICCRPD